MSRAQDYHRNASPAMRCHQDQVAIPCVRYLDNPLEGQAPSKLIVSQGTPAVFANFALRGKFRLGADLPLMTIDDPNRLFGQSPQDRGGFVSDLAYDGCGRLHLRHKADALSRP